jgi:siroheme synthase (precorrin-2 oxidase/ferrochelatase)
MIQAPFGEAKTSGMTFIGSQPVALAAATLVVMVVGAGSIAAWRAYTGASPEQDRVVAARQLQVRAAQASEQLVEKTTALELTQQEAIDQLQVVQDQLQTIKRLLATQQTDTKRLSDQIGELTGAVERLRQSFASAQSQEASAPPSPRKDKTPNRKRRDKRRTSQAP